MRSGARGWQLACALTAAALGLLFLWQLLALWQSRLDYPIHDDWRYYDRVLTMPGVFSPAWLLAPAKDTLHVTGKLLDWLVLVAGVHDYRWLAASSFLVAVGAWLLCTLRLCFVATPGRPGVRLAALAVVALPLAGVPYWVAVSPHQQLVPAIAYHQMLPVAVLGALGLVGCSPALAVRRRTRLALALALTLAGSLAYSSGAFALCLFGGGVASLAGSRRAGADGRGLGAAIAALAGLCLTAHVLLPLHHFGVNPVVETREHRVTVPFEPEFWWFWSGLFDRAVLSTAADRGAHQRGLGASAAVAFAVPGLALLLVRGRLRPEARRAAVVLAASLSAVLGYAALVSYGRASFGEFYFLPRHFEGVERATLYAHTRIFYWWISAALPLVVLAWGIALEDLGSRRLAALGTAALAMLLLWPKAQHPESRGGYLRHWDYAALYAADAERVRGLIGSDVDWMLQSLRERDPQRTSELRRRIGVYRRAERLKARFVERWGLLDPLR